VASEAVARQEARKERPARVDQAGLLRRTFAVDVFAYVRCGGRRRVLAYVKGAGGVRAILAHLGLPSAGAPLAPARGPSHAAWCCGPSRHSHHAQAPCSPALPLLAGPPGPTYASSALHAESTGMALFSWAPLSILPLPLRPNPLPSTLPPFFLCADPPSRFRYSRRRHSRQPRHPGGRSPLDELPGPARAW
jgi:hypothetical protein